MLWKNHLPVPRNQCQNNSVKCSFSTITRCRAVEKTTKKLIYETNIKNVSSLKPKFGGQIITDEFKIQFLTTV